MNTSGGPLKYHLESAHGMQAVDSSSPFSSSSSSSSSCSSSLTPSKRLPFEQLPATDRSAAKKFKQSTLHTAFAATFNNKLHVDLVTFLASCSLPHQLVDHPAFLTLCESMRNSTITLPNRHRTRELIMQHAESVRQDVLKMLKSKSAVSIAFDGWTNVNHNKITNIVPICNAKAHYWCSVANYTDKNDAEWLIRMLLVDS